MIATWRIEEIIRWFRAQANQNEIVQIIEEAEKVLSGWGRAGNALKDLDDAFYQVGSEGCVPDWWL